MPSDSMVSDFEQSEKKIDPIRLHWERLDKIPEEEICTGTGAVLITAGVLALKFLDRDVFCHLNEKYLKYSDGKLISDLQTTVLLLSYLQRKPSIPSSGQPDPHSDKPISPLQLPNGDVFFRGAHALPSARLEEAFGYDPQGFLKAGKSLGGAALSKGDASFCLKALPCIDIYFYLYSADEEFPAQAKIMFDRSITDYLPLDSIWALTNVVVKRLLEFKDASKC